MQKNLKWKKNSDICLAWVGLFNPSSNGTLNCLIYIPNINKFTRVTQSHNMGFGDILKGMEVFWAVNDLHMFTSFIRTESTWGLSKAEICKLYEVLFPPLTCSHSLLRLSSGIYVNLSTIIHPNKNIHNPELVTPVPVYSAVENIRCLNLRTVGAWINKR